jgi:putative PIN family toxin of toxin-antitoxin system
MSVRAVFDCMLFLQAATNEAGPAFACFQLVEAGEVALHVSPEILAEVRDVLNRPSIRRKFPHLTAERIEEFVTNAETRGVLLDQVPKAFSYARDPDDEPYLNLAIAVDAQYLVSRDKDLLDLMADPAFRGQYPGLAIVDPVTYLRTLKPPGSERDQGS